MLTIDELKQMFPDFHLKGKHHYNAIEIFPDGRDIRLKKYGVAGLNRIYTTFESNFTETMSCPSNPIEQVIYDKGIDIVKVVFIMDETFRYYETTGTFIIIVRNRAYICEFKRSKI